MQKRFYLFLIFYAFAQSVLYANPTDSLSVLLKSAKSDKEKVSLLIKKGKELTLTNSSEALILYRKAEKLAADNDFTIQLIDVDIALGDFYFKIGKLDSAEVFYEKGIAICKSNNIVKEKIDCKGGIGAVYFYKADYAESLKWYYEALSEFEHYQNDTTKAAILNKLAGVHFKLQDYPKTLEHLKESLKLKEKIGDSLAMSKTYNNLGNVYADLKEYDKALYYYNKDLDISIKKNNLFNIAISNTNIASIYREKGNYKKALGYAQEALKIDSIANDLYGITADYTEIYYAYIGMKKYAEAEPYLSESLQIARKIKAEDLELTILNDFSDFFVKQNNYKKALEYYKQHASLKDSLLNEIKNHQIVEADKKYETQKKNAEIQQLTIKQIKDEKMQLIYLLIIASLTVTAVFLIFFFRQRVKINKILNAKNTELKQLNVTQNRLMSIISHDFKAPLSAFYSITNSLKTKFDKINRKEIDNFLNRMLNSSIALKLQLENMLNWAINQQREIRVSKSSYNLSVLAYKVVMILQEFANEKSITIENKITDDIEIDTDGGLLSIVLNNLIANAVKFSPNNSVIDLSAQKHKAHIIISVKDYGIGMSKDIAQNLFSDKDNSTHNENSGTGLGLIVSKDIIEKLGGKIWAESELDKGTTVFIEI